jgi:hypothetical protein
MRPGAGYQGHFPGHGAPCDSGGRESGLHAVVVRTGARVRASVGSTRQPSGPPIVDQIKPFANARQARAESDGSVGRVKCAPRSLR